jgi:hypothetical protein
MWYKFLFLLAIAAAWACKVRVGESSLRASDQQNANLESVTVCLKKDKNESFAVSYNRDNGWIELKALGNSQVTSGYQVVKGFGTVTTGIEVMGGGQTHIVLKFGDYHEVSFNTNNNLMSISTRSQSSGMGNVNTYEPRGCS